MAVERTRVGLHARNDVLFPNRDYELVRRAKIETMKMMSFTDPTVFDRLRRENEGIDFIVRLYDDRFNPDSRPAPADFVSKMLPLISRLQPYTTKFEIHNEPNHVARIEGWGASDDNAHAFRGWYMQVLQLLRQAVPWASLGFPGLALNHPHRDLEWLAICQDAVKASDWLGCHCYWQYGNMFHDQWGLRFKLYHDRFPNKRIEITEFGNSTPNLPASDMASQYARYYAELAKYSYLGSASAFIASSPDPTWAPFVWLKEGGEMQPVAFAVGDMARSPLVITPVEPTPVEPTPVEPTPVEPTPVEPTPVQPTPPKPTKRLFPETGKTVSGAFLEFFDNYGLDICGYPITEQIVEAGLQTQYFQRLAMEQLKSGKIRLKLAGTEAWTSRARLAELEARVQELSQRPPAAGTGPSQPALVDLVDQLLKHASKRYPTRARTDIRRIIVHHTAGTATITPQRLAEYQVRSLDKPGITYHFVVGADGTVYQTNQLETVSEHAFEHSGDSVGVVFPGNFTNEIPTEQQLAAGGTLIAWLLGTLNLTTETVVGLGELVNTQSPGKQWLQGKKWKQMLLERVAQALAAAPVQPPVVGHDHTAVIALLQQSIQALEGAVKGLQAESQTTPVQPPVTTPPAKPPVTTPPAKPPVTTPPAKPPVTTPPAKPPVTTPPAKPPVTTPPAKPPVTTPPATGGVPKPAIQDMIDKLPKHAKLRYNTRQLKAIDTLVIHHSAGPTTVGAEQIAAYHVKKLDWPGLGYHFIVGEDGTIYQGNSLQTISYHAVQENPNSVGICFLGTFQKKVPPAAQLRAGAHLAAWLMQELKLDLDDVKGHKEVVATQCPGVQWQDGQKWKQMLRREIAAVQAGEPAGQQAPVTKPEPAPVTKPEPAPTPTPNPAAGIGKTLYHYVLFWSHDGKWAERDWINALNYIGAFHPSAGVSAQDAGQAEYVTIVGGPAGVSTEVEQWLRAGGSKVERLSGKDEADTKRMLDELVQKGRRFQTFDE